MYQMERNSHKYFRRSNVHGNLYASFQRVQTITGLYEIQIVEKEGKFKESTLLISHRACIEAENLRFLNVAGWIESTSIDEFTESQLEKCVEERFK